MGNIGAVVLAAGGSTRLGEPKQLLILGDGETLVHSAVRAAREAGCARICVVTGAVHDQVASAVSGLHPTVAHNRDWARGIGSSIRLGVTRLSDVTAIVLLTCDQPALDAEIIRALLSRHEHAEAAIIASHYANTLGTPALFPRSYFPALRSLPDDSGAKLLIEKSLERVESVDFPQGAFDLDSPLDLQTWRKRRPHSSQASHSRELKEKESRFSLGDQ
jgi:molybdenum cofactor cytidylyltransferase